MESSIVTSCIFSDTLVIPPNSKDIVAWLSLSWVIRIVYVPDFFQYCPLGLISVLNFLSEPTSIWPTCATPFGESMRIVSWFPKARYVISPDTKIFSPSKYDDLSVETVTDSFDPNAGVAPRLVIKIPNNAKIINWDFTNYANSIYDI